MLRKTCELADFKMIEEGHGSLSGYGSTHGTKDLAGEIVVKGAFAKSLDQFKAAGFIAVGHEWSDLPVATVADAYEDEKGLFVKGEFHSSEEAQKARTYVRERLERGKSVGLSIGYTVKDSERTKDGLLLKEIDLFEVSIVTVPANPHANATSVKAMSEEPLSLRDLSSHCDDLFHARIYPLLFVGTSSLDERMELIDAALIELPARASLAFRSALAATAGDDDAKAELEAEFKQIFSVPARTAGRFDRQLLALLTEVEGAKSRADEIAALRKEQGRALFSPERREQLKALSEALTRLVETTAPTPDLDLPLLQMKANARRRRIAVACGAHDEQAQGVT